jgi:SsrA-binding protein
MKKDKDEKDAGPVIAENRKANFDYHILDTYEAGIVLLGTEIKSMREGGVSLRESFCKVKGAEVFLWNAHIAPYSHRGSSEHETTRTRKLLLHRQEINKLIGKTVEKGLTLVPLRMYFKKGRAKVVIALARGKNTVDKRETIKRREADRETRAAVKSRIR